VMVVFFYPAEGMARHTLSLLVFMRTVNRTSINTTDGLRLVYSTVKQHCLQPYHLYNVTFHDYAKESFYPHFCDFSNPGSFA
jgi:hypothetical protein